jgi:hypothetical protein
VTSAPSRDEVDRSGPVLRRHWLEAAQPRLGRSRIPARRATSGRADAMCKKPRLGRSGIPSPLVGEGQGGG